LFRLTNEFVKILNNMYRTLVRWTGLIAQPTLTGLSPSQADYKGWMTTRYSNRQSHKNQ
jgi:hypothetical protein